MAYLKSILVGLVVAAVAMIAWVFGEMALIVMPQIRALKPQDGSGGIGAVVVTSYVPYVGLAAFAMGFYLMLRTLKARAVFVRADDTEKALGVLGGPGQPR